MTPKVALVLALIAPIVIAANPTEDNGALESGQSPVVDQVREILCGTDECTPMLKSLTNFGNYQLIHYDLGGDEYGSATALVYLHNNKQSNVMKVFSGFGANGQVLQATVLNLDNAQYLEVYEMTSKGNGSYELFKLNSEKLEPMLEARGVDWHDDGAYFDGGILKATYPHMGGDAHFDVVLDGTVILTDEKSDKEIGRKECKRIFIWDAVALKLQETKAGEINRELCSEHEI